jgi:hypothetical protein
MRITTPPSVDAGAGPRDGSGPNYQVGFYLPAQGTGSGHQRAVPGGQPVALRLAPWLATRGSRAGLRQVPLLVSATVTGPQD